MSRDLDPVRAGIVNAAATARHRVRAHFAALHAVTPDDAIEYMPPGPRELREFTRLRRAGVIRDAAPGQHWLDLDRMGMEQRRMSPGKMAGIVALSVVMAVLLLLLYRG